MASLDVLTAALRSREVAVAAVANELRDDPNGANLRRVDLLREAAELIGCLRRLVAVPSVSYTDLQRVFGAPGDFGYETPIGDALAQIYRAGDKCKTCNGIGAWDDGRETCTTCKGSGKAVRP